MALERNKVLRRERPSKEDVRDALAADWSRCFPPSLRGTVAEGMGCSRGTVDNGVSGNHMPELHTALAALLVDPSALSTVLALYGFILAPKEADKANDFELAARIGHTLAEFLDRLRDGKRCHVDTAVLSALFRDLIPQMQAIVDEDDRRKLGLRAVK